jgi:protein translocase SecG subunit
LLFFAISGRVKEINIVSIVMLLKVLQIVQMVFAVLLIISILLQQKGSGMGAGFGAGAGPIVSTRRGVDLFLYKATIFLSVVFFAIGISFIILQ